MKNRSFLLILEQLCMILLFSLAAVLALRGFAEAKEIGREARSLEWAAAAAENMAETLKDVRGDFAAAAGVIGGELNGEGLLVRSNPHGMEIAVTASPTDSGHALLGAARITAACGEDVLLEITVSWQRRVENEG